MHNRKQKDLKSDWHFVLLSFFLLVSTGTYGQSLSLSFTQGNNTICDSLACDYDGPSILINEIMISPPSNIDGSLYGCPQGLIDNGIQCEGEWIELYNPNECEWVDISCYHLGNAVPESGSVYPSSFIIPEGTLIPPLGFAIIRGSNASPVPSNFLIDNGGNVVEVVVDQNGLCLSGADRFWLPNDGGWIAIYDNVGIPQDAVSWGNSQGVNVNACTPTPMGACGYNGQLIPYDLVPADRKTYIASTIPSNFSFKRIPDGGSWDFNTPHGFTYATCNTICNTPSTLNCDGQATVHVSGGTGPYTYQWDDPQAQTTATATGLCTGEYCVSVTDADNHVMTDCIFIEDYSPDLTASTTTPNVCIGDSVFLNAIFVDGNASYNFTWNGPLGFQSSSQNLVIVDAQLQYSGIYEVMIVDSNGCSGFSDIEVNVHPNPEPQITSSDPLCVGDSLQFDVGSYTSYAWLGPQGFTSEVQNPVIPNIQENQEGIYTVAVTDTNGCIGSQSIDVEVHPQMSAMFEKEDVTCFGVADGMATVIVYDGTPDYTYQWSTNPAQFTESVTGLSAGTYGVTITDSIGCTISESIAISAIDSIVLYAPDHLEINAGESAQLFVDVISGGTEPFVYEWTPSVTLDDYTLTDPLATPQGNTLYTVIVVDVDGCSSVVSTLVTLKELMQGDFAIPNVFAPEREGENAVFKIITQGNATVREFKIFNRWGEIVHDNSSVGWDGIYKGEKQPIGTYVYQAVIELTDGKQVPKTGTLILVR